VVKMPSPVHHHRSDDGQGLMSPWHDAAVNGGQINSLSTRVEQWCIKVSAHSIRLRWRRNFGRLHLATPQTRFQRQRRSVGWSGAWGRIARGGPTYDSTGSLNGEQRADSSASSGGERGSINIKAPVPPPNFAGRPIASYAQISPTPSKRGRRKCG